ncbi:hypothetical protein [Alkalicoccobacillus murimartini]|uniref:Type IV secretory pathway TrbL component n=1 Tax=Alkalicoccobacillus murimartini TaxID=171685 RepID=A0ABT9YIH3_9BACI|nr:hypothetical protein [Alkalicoccobacillus murimartini]MDQ0207649.1 type IV secretory pathway TrbL component [Alkalicoccobacillus murimartini]
MSMTIIRSIRIAMNLVLLVLAILQITGVINISPTLLIVLATIVLVSIFLTRWKETKDEHERNKK